MNQDQFLKDLESFISNHPYYKELEGSKKDDKFIISDPDGDHEEIQIQINLIS